MDAVVKSDIFFFITSIAVGIFTVLGIIIAIYLIRILKDVAEISDLAKEKSRRLSENFDAVMVRIKAESRAFARFIRLVISTIIRK